MKMFNYLDNCDRDLLNEDFADISTIIFDNGESMNLTAQEEAVKGGIMEENIKLFFTTLFDSQLDNKFLEIVTKEKGKFEYKTKNVEMFSLDLSDDHQDEERIKQEMINHVEEFKTQFSRKTHRRPTQNYEYLLSEKKQMERLISKNLQDEFPIYCYLRAETISKIPRSEFDGEDFIRIEWLSKDDRKSLQKTIVENKKPIEEIKLNDEFSVEAKISNLTIELESETANKCGEISGTNLGSLSESVIDKDPCNEEENFNIKNQIPEEFKKEEKAQNEPAVSDSKKGSNSNNAANIINAPNTNQPSGKKSKKKKGQNEGDNNKENNNLNESYTTVFSINNIVVYFNNQLVSPDENGLNKFQSSSQTIERGEGEEKIDFVYFKHEHEGHNKLYVIFFYDSNISESDGIFTNSSMIQYRTAVEKHIWEYFKENVIEDPNTIKVENQISTAYESYLKQFESIEENTLFIMESKNGPSVDYLIFQIDRCFEDFKKIILGGEKETRRNVILLMFMSSKQKKLYPDDLKLKLKYLYEKFQGKVIILDIDEDFCEFSIKSIRYSPEMVASAVITNTGIQKLENRLEKLETGIVNELKNVETGLKNVETGLKNVEGKLDTVVDKISTLTSEISELNKLLRIAFNLPKA